MKIGEALPALRPRAPAGCAANRVDDLRTAEHRLREGRATAGRVRAEIDRLRAGIVTFSAYQDTHAPGRWIADGSSHSPADTVQVCADDECGGCWPCSAAEVIALLETDAEERCPTMDGN